MLAVTSYIGRRQGPRFVVFYGCMFYAMMRPSEVTSLSKDGCQLPDQGWGRLIFADASPAAGRDFTNDGRVHESKGLKGRARQSSARRATRSVPIPPELVAMIRAHIERFGTSADGRIFRSENDNLIQPFYLLAGLGQDQGAGPHARAARDAAHAQTLRPTALRHHLAAEFRGAADRDRRMGRAQRRDAATGVRPVRRRHGGRLDRPDGLHAPA